MNGGSPYAGLLFQRQYGDHQLYEEIHDEPGRSAGLRGILGIPGPFSGISEAAQSGSLYLADG